MRSGDRRAVVYASVCVCVCQALGSSFINGLGARAEPHRASCRSGAVLQNEETGLARLP